MSLQNYYRDEIAGEAVYRCCSCPHDTFDPLAAKSHQKFAHGDLPRSIHDLPQEQWLSTLERAQGNVVIGVLTCNDGEAAIKSLRAANSEGARLNKLGYECHIIWVDNGSSDLRQIYSSLHANPLVGCPLAHLHNKSNLGQSVARNQIIEHCILELADWLIMVDGDITLIPYSGHALIDAARRERVECMGLFSLNCSSGDDIDTECRSLMGLTLPNHDPIAWTQYGAFDCGIFRDGLKFDESGPFYGEGWGFEDDDFGIQMLEKGYKLAYSNHFRYGHYRRHSSLRRMDPTLAAKVYSDRKQYVYTKWKSHKNYAIAKAAATLNVQTMPVLR